MRRCQWPPASAQTLVDRLRLRRRPNVDDGELVEDAHVYCFAATGMLFSPHYVTRRMYDHGELIDARPDHPDLACWKTELEAWEAKFMPLGPLRMSPRGPLPEGV